ncbi:methyltransferase domain-containing protein [filamentous cyanobacterium LEGE 11480]|uniref:Methyltransferase domain-containing protein n=1 Tax=Romeriopsis navalis LEGE 11480 TaxID=2777977 RepID=A0A928VTN8_9CYAN|nr:methyltransferase domain-containing protein [Romeriopsis navalis]MBE9032380.1 methyltransferase domain-containing protein [Romeriopsis navalis LEGE 11480]
MSDQIDLDEYKQQVADLYSSRSSHYDNGDWHPRIAHRLVEYAQLNQGQQILDIATGTGMVAIEAAQIVGNEGQVVGVDISSGMIKQARRKAKALGLCNIEFQLADAEVLNFPVSTFDYIFCSSALIWMSDLLGALRLWHRFLKPGGIIGFHAFADTAFLGGVVTQKVLEKYDISLLFSKPTGTIEKCHALLQQAGFDEIDIKSEPDGRYISLEKAKGMWSGDGSFPAPGQHPNPSLQLTSKQLAQARVEFDAELEKLQTKQGIWDDSTIFYSFGRKAT